MLEIRNYREARAHREDHQGDYWVGYCHSHCCCHSLEARRLRRNLEARRNSSFVQANAVNFTDDDELAVCFRGTGNASARLLLRYLQSLLKWI